MPKMRLDALVLARGFADTRARAQALIMARKIRLGEMILSKPGQMLEETAEIFMEGREHPWVSRGGMKLAHALSEFDVRPEGWVCLDVGASTGGFTDVLLQRGAARVYAVDVGHGQLDWNLRRDPRVVVLEKTNARYLTEAQVPEAVDAVVCDASFIGLKTVLPAALERAKERATLIALIKPQFEAGRGKVGKGGVVRDANVHEEICAELRRWVEEEQGWRVRGITESPVRGPKGNIEFLLCAVRARKPLAWTAASF
jgi:23S rRNA (cytidine1920-2'-O)/16S rRNA (cytidine1409-2'-O)-methyltransferase